MTRDEPLLVGVDAGTSNTKAVVFTRAGRVVAQASTPTPIHYPRPEWAEYDAESLWQTAAAAVRTAINGLDDPSRIAGICFASMGETAVPIAADGSPTGPAIAWFDKRARAEVESIVERIGQDRLFAISGLAPEPIFGLCKLLWHQRHRTDAFSATTKWLNTADYLAWRLSGEMATDYSLACRTFALDLANLAWSEEILRTMNVDPALMAPLVRSGAAIGKVSDAGAAATGLPRHCVVAAGGHDHVIGAVAADAMRPGTLLCSTGTTEASVMGTDRPSQDPALGRAGYVQGICFVEAPVWFTMGGLYTAGGAIDWFRQSVAGGASYETLIAEAGAAPPGSRGAVFVPHLRLGTAPGPNAHAKGAFLGLSTDVTRGDLFRAVLEGIAADSRHCADGIVERLGRPPPDAIRVIGGITKNRLYMAIKAAMHGRPITVVDLPDSVAAGAALLASLAARIHPSQQAATEAMRATERTIPPDPEAAALYETAYQTIHKPAAPIVRPIHDAINAATSDKNV
jgi:xylulokinase